MTSSRLEGITNPLPSDPSVPLSQEDVDKGNLYSSLWKQFALLARVASLEGGLASLAGTINDLGGDVAELQTDVGALQATDGQDYVEVVAESSPRKFLYIGEDRRVTKIEAKRLSAVNPGAGVADVVVQNGTNQTLQSASTSDATALTADWTELELSVTAGRLDLANGIVIVGLNTQDAGASGGPVWFRVTHIPIPA